MTVSFGIRNGSGKGKAVRRFGFYHSVAVLIALCVLPHTATAGRATDGAQYGVWQVFTWWRDNGDFSHCALTNQGSGLNRVMISMGAGGLLLSFDMTGRVIRPGESVEVLAHVDQQAWFGPLYGRVFALENPPDVLLDFDWDQTFFQGLRNGRMLTIIDPQRQVAYDVPLNGSAPAIDHMNQCSWRHQGRGF